MEELYREVEPMYDMHLVTKSCFHKVIGWTHIVENPEFIELLHGDELIFSAGIQYTSEEWLMDFVQRICREYLKKVLPDIMEEMIKRRQDLG